MRPWGLNFCWNRRNCQGVTKIKILNAPNQIIYTHRPALTSYAAEKKKLLFKIQKLLVPRWFSQHPSKEEIIPNYVPHFSCDLQKADRSRAGSNHQPYSNQFLPRTKRFTIPFTERNAVVQLISGLLIFCFETSGEKAQVYFICCDTRGVCEVLSTRTAPSLWMT